jgi:hypothetical protein
MYAEGQLDEVAQPLAGVSVLLGKHLDLEGLQVAGNGTV